MPATSGSTRITPMWLVVLALALLAARITLGIVEHAHPKLPPSLVRYDDPRGAEAAARLRGLPLLFVFVKEGQEESQQLEAEVFADPALARLVNRGFVALRLAETAGGTRIQVGGDRAGRYHITKRPALVVANPENDRNVVLTGFPGRIPTAQWLARAPLEVGMDSPLGRSLPAPGSPGDTLADAPVDSVLPGHP